MAKICFFLKLTLRQLEKNFEIFTFDFYLEEKRQL